MNKEDSVKWMQRRVEEYRSGKNDMHEAIDVSFTTVRVLSPSLQFLIFLVWGPKFGSEDAES